MFDQERVGLDGDHSRRTRKQVLGKRSLSGADLDGELLILGRRRGRNAFENGTSDKEVLPEATEMGACCFKT